MNFEGIEPVPIDMNAVLPQIAITGGEAFDAQWQGSPRSA